ncbi:MAG: hypothetical protein HY053_06895 [Proteobacteria bacterium]|nr:hypothetical protein [Pseudomonadota bacterium]
MPRFSFPSAGLALALAAELVTAAHALPKSADPLAGPPQKDVTRAVDAAKKFAARLFPDVTYGPGAQFTAFAGYFEGKGGYIVVSPKTTPTTRTPWLMVVNPKTEKVKAEYFSGLCNRRDGPLTCTNVKGETVSP